MFELGTRYILSSFVLDVTIVAIDWVMFSADISKTGSSNAVDIARLGKLFRIMRLLRILRLVRAIKFVDLSTKFGDLLMTMTVQWRSVFQLLGILRLPCVGLVIGARLLHLRPLMQPLRQYVVSALCFLRHLSNARGAL